MRRISLSNLIRVRSLSQMPTVNYTSFNKVRFASGPSDSNPFRARTSRNFVRSTNNKPSIFSINAGQRYAVMPPAAYFARNTRRLFNDRRPLRNRIREKASQKQNFLRDIFLFLNKLYLFGHFNNFAQGCFLSMRKLFFSFPQTLQLPQQHQRPESFLPACQVFQRNTCSLLLRGSENFF